MSYSDGGNISQGNLVLSHLEVYLLRFSIGVYRTRYLPVGTSRTFDIAPGVESNACAGVFSILERTKNIKWAPKE